MPIIPKKKKESPPQTTILDLTNCMSDQNVVYDLDKMDSMLRQLVVEADNPALTELDRLYKENPELKIDDPRVQNISSQLEEQLKSFDKTSSLDLNPSDNIKDYRFDYGGSSSGIAKHLAFVVQALNNDCNLSDVMNGYEYNGTKRTGMIERMQTQFNKDITRTPFIVMDQKGNVIHGDLSESIPRELNLLAINNEHDTKKYVDSLKEKTGMSDKEYDLISKNYTQRSMVGVGSAFAASAGYKLPNQTERKNILHVHVDDRGNRKLTSIEYREKIISNKIGEDGFPIIDEYTEKPIQNPLFDISYKLELNDGPPRRTVTIQELSPEGRVQLPTCLQSKTIPVLRTHQNEMAERKAIDKIMLQAITQGNSEIANDLIEMQNNIADKLERSTLLSLCQGALALDEENKNKVIEGFIKKEIREIKANNPTLSAQEIADQAQEGISTLIGPQGIPSNDSKNFNKALLAYIKNESSKNMFPLVKFIRRCMGNTLENEQQKLIEGMRIELQARDENQPANNSMRSASSQKDLTVARKL